MPASTHAGAFMSDTQPALSPRVPATLWLAQGLISGTALCWALAAWYRVVWDGLAPWAVWECWGATVLALLTLLPAQALAARDRRFSWRHLGAVLLGAGLGLYWVMSWQLQVLDQRSQSDHALTRQSDIPVVSVIGYATDLKMGLSQTDPACHGVRHLWATAIAGNPEWEMSMPQKMWVRQRFLVAHQAGCFQDREIFAMVQHLRHRPVRAAAAGTATFDWQFTPSDTQYDEQAMAITGEQWCAHQAQQAWSTAIAKEMPEDVADSIQSVCSNLPSADRVLLQPAPMPQWPAALAQQLVMPHD